MSGPVQPPLRVEQALRLLPDIDAIAPLRAYVIATSWMRRPSRPHQTMGKRYIQPADLRDLVPRAIAQVGDHLAALYDVAIAAMEAEQQGDAAAAARALQEAGALEERVGRHGQARAWYEHALRIAEGLHDRRPEVETLLRLGHLDANQGQYEGAARRYQRALALADAEQDPQGATEACRGLGDVEQAQAKWRGAGSWYARGLRYADGERRLTGMLYVGQGEAAFGRGELDDSSDWLQRAREVFTELRDDEGLARALRSLARLYATRRRRSEALGTYTEALALLRRRRTSPALEVAIRLDICNLYLDWDRLADADDEVRRAEETAIVHNLTRQLARLYLVMGKVRAHQGDESGFVFFEKAIELCRGNEPSPRLEAEAYVGYARFRDALGEHDEARSYLERAREILEGLGDESALGEIEAQLAPARSS